jgi:hypothetical protein
MMVFARLQNIINLSRAPFWFIEKIMHHNRERCLKNYALTALPGVVAVGIIHANTNQTTPFMS